MNNDNLKWREIDFTGLDDTERVFTTPEELDAKAKFVDANLWEKVEKIGKRISFAKDIKALYKYMKARDVSWHRKTIVVGTLVYFIAPIDAIPDISPLIGYLDDLGVITALIKYLGNELTSFYN